MRALWLWGVAAALAGLSCRSVTEMMSPPAASPGGARCRLTALDPGPDARPEMVAVESAADQYLLLLPYDADWQINCDGENALVAISRDLQLQGTIRITGWNAQGIQPEDYLTELAKRAGAVYQRRRWAMQNAAIVHPLQMPILQYRVDGEDAAGVPFTQYNYVTIRRRQDGRVVELTLSLDNPNPVTLPGREGSLYYFLSDFFVKGQARRMHPVPGSPPAYR